MSEASPPCSVYKLGGSLLNSSTLPAGLAWIRDRRPGVPKLLVVGGGATADVVREWDRLFQLGEERAHWLALESLALNELLVRELWPELRPVRSLGQFQSAAAEGVPAILCAGCFVRWGERSGAPPLPHRWDVTTDSIAAWTAAIVGAGELVLLKSLPLPQGMSVEEAAVAGHVDPWFAIAVRPVESLVWVNLRAHPILEQAWTRQP